MTPVPIEGHQSLRVRRLALQIAAAAAITLAAVVLLLNPVAGG